MITMTEVYSNGIDWLISKNNEKKLENECIKRLLETKHWCVKLIEYIKEIV